MRPYTPSLLPHACQVDTAGRLARQAVALNWRCRPAWLLLARCYSAEGLYAEALVALNALPTPPLPRDERELLFVVPPPPPARVTAPQQLVYAADLEAARALALEDDDTGGGASRLLAYLPGAGAALGAWQRTAVGTAAKACRPACGAKQCGVVLCIFPWCRQRT